MTRPLSAFGAGSLPLRCHGRTNIGSQHDAFLADVTTTVFASNRRLSDNPIENERRLERRKVSRKPEATTAMEGIRRLPSYSLLCVPLLSTIDFPFASCSSVS